MGGLVCSGIHGRFETESVADLVRNTQSFDELQNMVRKAIDYHNNKRYHSTIGLKTPPKFTKEQVGHLTVH